MIKALKKITIQMVGGANIATILIMLLVGYSDRIDPLVHPFWANMGLAFPVFLVINTVFLVFWAIFKVRGCVIPIIGFILCYVPARTYVPINISRDAPEGAITVMSYNVYLFGAAGVPDEERQLNWVVRFRLLSTRCLPHSIPIDISERNLSQMIGLLFTANIPS